MNNRLIGKFIFVLLLLWPASFTVDNRSYFAGGVLTPPLFKYRKGNARPLWNPHLNGCTLQAAWSTKSAAEPTPVDLWKTIDDNTGQPKGLVRISERNGGIEGRVEKFSPSRAMIPRPSVTSATALDTINRCSA